MGKTKMLGDLWLFMRVRKKWWLTPIIVFLLFMSALIVLTHGTALAPFVYTVF